MKVHKTFKFGITFLILAAITIGFLKETTRWPLGELASVQRGIDHQVEETYRTGQKGEISFQTSSDSILLISPPYASLSGIADKTLSPMLKKEMETEINWVETGHLFLVRNGEIIDHRLLSGYAEPILGSSEGTNFVFSVTREKTSGRPVRIELMKQK